MRSLFIFLFLIINGCKTMENIEKTQNEIIVPTLKSNNHVLISNVAPPISKIEKKINEDIVPTIHDTNEQINFDIKNRLKSLESSLIDIGKKRFKERLNEQMQIVELLGNSIQATNYLQSLILLLLEKSEASSKLIQTIKENQSKAKDDHVKTINNFWDPFLSDLIAADVNLLEDINALKEIYSKTEGKEEKMKLRDEIDKKERELKTIRTEADKIRKQIQSFDKKVTPVFIAIHSGTGDINQAVGDVNVNKNKMSPGTQ